MFKNSIKILRENSFDRLFKIRTVFLFFLNEPLLYSLFNRFFARPFFYFFQFAFLRLIISEKYLNALYLPLACYNRSLAFAYSM